MKTQHFFIIAICALLLVACHDENTIAGITLNRAIVQIDEDSTLELSATVNPIGTEFSHFVWTSSDNAVATVVDGLVTAHVAGQATITVSAGNHSAACLVVVEPIDLSRFVQMPKSSKRGVSFSYSVTADVELLAPCTSWSYNWGPDAIETVGDLFDKYALDFCPMAWNGGFDADRIRAYVQAHPTTKYLLAFNEPNLTDQCNYTPAQAAAQWPRLKTLADELNLKIVSPAMNYGTLANYSDPLVWLDEFFTMVPSTDIDAIAIHCYMGNAGAMKSYIDRFRKYGKPIWMTEFCAWERNIGNVQAQANFMSEAINYMECDPLVERYAWFMPRTSGALDSYPYMQLLTKTKPFALSELGRVFAGLSAMDKNVWHTSERVLAQEYSNICTSESVTGSFVGGPHLRPTTDVGGQLDVCDFYTGQWIEYQIQATGSETTMRLRYTALTPSTCQVLLDGQDVATINLPMTESWALAECALPLDAGHHTMRLAMQQGNAAVHWLKFTK